MNGGMGKRGMNEKPQNTKATIKKLMSYFKPYKTKMLIILLFAIISTVFVIVGPKVLAKATDKIADGFVNKTIYNKVMENIPKGMKLPEGTTGKDLIQMIPEDVLNKMDNNTKKNLENIDFSEKPKMDFSGIRDIVFICIIIYIISALFNYIQSFMISTISQKVTYELRTKVFRKIDKIPLSYFDKQNNGDILSRVTNDVDMLGNTISQGLSQTVIIFTTIIGVLIMMLTISPLMTLIAIIILPISFALVGIIMSFSQKYFTKQQSGLGKINSHIEEMYAGHNIVKVFNKEKDSIKKFNEYNNNLYESAWKSQFFSGLMMPIVNFVGNIGYVGICILGGNLVIKKKINIGDIQAFIQYLRQFTQSTGQSASVISGFQSTLAATERIFEFLEVEEEIKDKKNAVNKVVSGDVEFKHVKFGYDEDKTIIKDFSIKIKKGSKIAIVGPTGAGKTTLVKLLMRFYDVNSGEIKIDNVNIKDYKKSSLRKNFGMVLQDTWLFNGTVLDNIKYGNDKATEEQTKDAIKQARVDHFVSTLPDSYNYILNEEGNNISAGEKQLLTIARAILADPKILILDEATSSVDTRTEVLINDGMKNLMKNRTSFIIAHRLSTIKNADKIIVMNKGDIVEVGTHDELLNKKQFYYTLYNSQFENSEI